MSSFIPRLKLDLIDLLLGEHASMLTLFRHFENTLATLDLAAVHAAAAALESVLMAHAIDEDGLLFRSLPAGHGGVGETLDAMFAEHNELRFLLEQLAAQDNAARARADLRRLLELAREHFAVEERTLFGLARRVLSQKTLSTLGAEFARRRGLAALP